MALPALSTLEELVASVSARAQDEVYTRIGTRLLPALQRALDEILQIPTGDHICAISAQGKSPEASPVVILCSIERDHFLHDLGVETIDLSRK